MGTLRPVNQLGTNTYSADAKQIRYTIKDFFSGECSVVFHYDRLTQ